MTNAIATTDQKPPAKAPIVAGRGIAALNPQTVEEYFRLADALSGAGDMVPKSFQGKPREIMAAMMRGAEVGLSPMQSLESIAVINGRATLWGDAIPALIQRAGHHVDVELEGSGDKMVAVATLTRGDTGKVIIRRFSVDDAKRANLWGKAGPWQQYPQRMLSARARSWAVRDGAADALRGWDIAEEHADYGPDTARDITPRRSGGVSFLAPLPAVAPTVDDIIDPDPRPTPEQMAAAEADALAAINGEQE